MANINSVKLKLQKLGWSKEHIELKVQPVINELEAIGIRGLNKFYKKLAGAPDEFTFRDYWLEGTYSRVFAKNNLTVTMEPCGREGPDMLININGRNIYLEVRHFRQVPDATRSRARFVSSAIKDKLTQILDNEINIVVIRNGRLDMSIRSFYKGIYLCKAFCTGNANWAEKWSNLSGVIMDMSFLDSRTHEPFYWRFLRTSKKKVPSEVKRRMSEILEKQVAIEHQKIMRC